MYDKPEPRRDLDSEAGVLGSGNSTSGCFSDTGVVKGLSVLLELDDPGGGGVFECGREKLCTSLAPRGDEVQSAEVPVRRLLGTKRPVSATCDMR